MHRDCAAPILIQTVSEETNMLSWDSEDTQDQADQEEDFLLSPKDQGEVPKACPINPDDLEGCLACQ
jgi:hypothetical protein